MDQAASGMTEARFWEIIGLLDWDKTGDDNAVLEPAVAALAKLTPEEIDGFEDILTEKQYELDGEKYAREMGKFAFRKSGGLFSADTFLAARCCVVANGRACYEAVRANPKRMLKDMEFEALLDIADKAYERKTGQPFMHDSPLSYETFSNTAGWPQS